MSPVRTWQKAIRALQNGIRVRRSGYQLLMQVALLPSRPMHPATAYSLLHSSDADQAPYMLVRSTWDSEMDLARLQSEPSLPATVEPTISQTEAIVDVERARILHKSIAGLSIPLIPSKPPSGLDGTTIEVTIGDAHFSGCRIWWGQTARGVGSGWRPCRRTDRMGGLTRVAPGSRVGL